MANDSIFLPLLFWGVSTQAPAIRFPGQVAAATNALMTAITGTELRPGTRMEFAISAAPTPPATTLPPTTLPPTTLPPATTIPATTLPPTTLPDNCTEYTISGAGTAYANVTCSYVWDLPDGSPVYRTLDVMINFAGGIWNIWGFGTPSGQLYAGDASATPDACVWIANVGAAPVPTVACSATQPPTTLPPTTIPPTTIQ